MTICIYSLNEGESIKGYRTPSSDAKGNFSMILVIPRSTPLDEFFCNDSNYMNNYF